MWENVIDTYVKKTGYPPEFAKGWYAKRNAISQETVEASNNWYMKAKG